MSIMIIAGKARHHSHDALHFPKAANIFLIVSAIVLIVPIAALALSFVMGGAAVSETLLLYLFSILWTAPLLVASVIICAELLTVRQLFQLSGHGGEEVRHFDALRESASKI